MPRREHDDRHGGPAADVAADVGAWHVWEAEVEHDERGALRGGQVEPLAPRRGLQHPPMLGLERVPDHPADLRLVVDHEHRGERSGHAEGWGRSYRMESRIGGGPQVFRRTGPGNTSWT